MPEVTHTPAQLASLTGLSVGNQRTWRRDGFFRDHGQQSPGGFWTFSPRDVLFVASARAIAEMGFSLGVAGMLADTFMLEIEGAIVGKTLAHPERKFAFAWKREDCTPEAEAALPKARIAIERSQNGCLTQDWLTIHQSGGWCAAQTNALEDLPRLSRAGGVLLIPADLARKIPPSVTDLFKSGA